MTKCFECMVNQDVELDIGTRVYVVEADGGMYCKRFVAFSSKCPVCNDNKSITVNGYTIECSYCKGNKNHAIELRVYDYVVHEYIINEVSIVGSTYKRDYKAKPVCSARFKGFYKCGNDNRAIKSMDFDSLSFREVKLDGLEFHCDLSGKGVFLSKEDAVEFAKELHQKQKELLTEFNQIHETDHDYPFSL